MVRQRFDSAVQLSIDLEDWETVRSRLKSDTERVRSRTIYKSQMSALHLACKHDPPIDVINLLIEANPHAAFIRSHPHGELPLHYATGSYIASSDVINELVKLNPAAVATQRTDDLRTTPLHQVCTFHAPYEIIKMLVDACPRALDIKDGLGRTPWDIAKIQYFDPFHLDNWKVLYLLAPGNRKRNQLKRMHSQN